MRIHTGARRMGQFAQLRIASEYGCLLTALAAIATQSGFGVWDVVYAAVRLARAVVIPALITRAAHQYARGGPPSPAASPASFCRADGSVLFRKRPQPRGERESSVLGTVLPLVCFVLGGGSCSVTSLFRPGSSTARPLYLWLRRADLPGSPHRCSFPTLEHSPQFHICSVPRSRFRFSKIRECSHVV